MLQRYETRIKVSDVVVDMKPPRRRSNDQMVHVSVQVMGELTLGRKEKFHYPDSEIADEAKEVFPLLIPLK